MVVHYLLEALEGRVGKDCLGKAVSIDGKSEERVEVYSQAGLRKFNQEGVTGRIRASWSC